MDDTTLLLIGAGILGFLFLRRKGVIGAPTSVVRSHKSGVHFNPPHVTYWNFPCPTSGKMLQDELAFAKAHGIYLDPNTLPLAIKKKIGYTGIKEGSTESPISHIIV